MESKVELASVEIESPQAEEMDLIEFDDLDTIKFPAHRPVADSAPVEITIEVVDEADGVEIELGADDVDMLLTDTTPNS